MAALDSPGTSTSAKTVFWQLMRRSGWAVAALLGVVALISLLPTPEEPYDLGGPSELGTLKHVLVLHRHGACRARSRLAAAVAPGAPLELGTQAQ